MKIHHTAHKSLQKIPQNDALRVIYALFEYKAKRQGYVKWLEGRRGYRIRIGQYRVIFEFEETDNEMTILAILKNPIPHTNAPPGD